MSSFSVAGFEARRLLRDRALPALLMLLLLLSTYAAWNGADWVKERENAIGLIQTEERDMASRMQKFAGTMPSVMPRTQPVLPPGTMGALSMGQADAYPFTADVIALGDITQLFKRVWADIGSPTARAAGRFDLAFVIVFLLPLLVLTVTYDIWSRERERGIAGLVLSQPGSGASLIAVKALVRGSMVLVPALVILVGSAAWAGATDPAGLAGLALIVLAYGSFWLALTVLIGFFARRSTEAAIAVGAIWLFVVVMAPSLTVATVYLIAPPPSEMRFSTDTKAKLAEITKRQELHRQSHPTPERSPAPNIPDRVRDQHADLVAADLELGPMIQSHQQALDARRRVLDQVRFFLPSVTVQDALDRIAGSDASRALAFQEQVLAFRQARRLLHQGYLERDQPQTVAEYNIMPGFQFQESGSEFQSGVLADVAALLLFSFLIATAAWIFRDRASTP